MADDSNADQVTTLDSEMPSKPDAAEMWDPGGSPFLLHRHIMGDRFLEWRKRLDLFRSWAEHEWPALKRLISYYLDSNWGQFDVAGKGLLKKTWPDPTEIWQRHDYLHRLLDAAFMSLCVEMHYPDMKKQWLESSLPPYADSAKTAVFAANAVNNDVINRLQKSIFHCLELFMENRSALLPGLPVHMYPSGKSQAVLELRLFRDDFPALRDLYVATFESCHKVLRYVVGQLNIAKRGNPDAFAEGSPKNITAFERLVSAEKARRLREIPFLCDVWIELLDRDLRNAISHHGVHHDLSSGKLMFDGYPELPYLEFVAKGLALIHPILFAANVLKTMHVMALLGRNRP
ncbi:MAG: hypothetical protein KAT11_00120 [Phycisphaerae bacterium]|nr:hypothetical protein [Phycisphaerae bacterium]